VTNDAKIISLLGLAQKAGKIASGELSVEKAIKSGKTKLLIVATDCSESTKKNYRDMTAYYGVELYEKFSKEQLGQCIGKVYRAALSITDVGFTNAVKNLLNS
jgi:ribosomal protein L7Ae-like RNA K-turn-binding protein